MGKCVYENNLKGKQMLSVQSWVTVVLSWIVTTITREQKKKKKRSALDYNELAYSLTILCELFIMSLRWGIRKVVIR